MDKKRGSLLVIIVGSILGAVLITSISLEIFAITSTLKTNATQSEVYRSRLLEDIKTELKSGTDDIFILYDHRQAALDLLFAAFIGEEAWPDAEDLSVRKR